MAKFDAVFIGRKKGAIGIFYRIATTVDGPTVEAARVNLYDRYEHISGLQLTKIEEPLEMPRTQGEHEVVVISADRPVEYGVLDGNTIKVKP